MQVASALAEPAEPVLAQVAAIGTEMGSGLDKEMGRLGDKESGGAAAARGFDTAAPNRANAVAHIGSAGASPSRLRAAHGNADSPRDDALVAWLSVSRDRGRVRFGHMIEYSIDGTGGASGTRGTHGLHDWNCLAGDGLLNYVDAIFELVGSGV